MSDKASNTNNWPASPHEATRFIMDALPHCSPVAAHSAESDRFSHGEDVPVLMPPELIEGNVFQAIGVADPRAPRGPSGFTGFLDGTQDIRIVNQIFGIPIVWGTVSAAVRARVNRRLVTWSGSAPIVRRGYYMPFRYVDGLRDDLRSHPQVTDTARSDSTGNVPSRHPAALMEAAVQKIQLDREAIELSLAEKWCELEKGVLFVDGSITGSRQVSASTCVVGVIKSHRRLYADGDAFRIVVGLRAGERSSIFRVAPRSRYPVASWYVRLRAPTGRDALFGLVRIEAALSSDMAARADEISRWIISEGSPLSLPDGRWDKMAYGIRDTEEFLRAIS